MATFHGNTHSDQAKMEQIIIEFLAKSLHIILESRTPYMSSRNFSGEQVMSSPSSSSSSSSSVRPRDKWFNLALRECPAALENLDLWRQSNLEPLVVDVILVQRAMDWDPVSFSPRKDLLRNLSSKERSSGCWSSDQEEFGCEAKSEKIIERWVVQYESRRSKECGSGSRRSSNNLLHALYKKTILLLRSLYATVRLLPAYKIFRDLNSSGLIRSFTLTHRVSSFVEPFTRREEAEMQRFVFNPVDTSSGRLCLSVLYRSSPSDLSSESSTPMSPQLIQDYVGSPLAEPLKRFPSLPVTESHGYPSSAPFSRRHSWSFDQYGASPSFVSFSPSPTHSESRACRFPPNSLPPHPREVSVGQKKDTDFDEYFPSPTFIPSPSPSPSPPTYIFGSHPSKALLRYGSAPVQIPAANSPALIKKSFPSSPPIRGTRSGGAQVYKTTGLVQKSAEVEKLFSLGIDDTRKYSGLKTSSNSSPRIPFSRSPSRSFQDDLDEPEFVCPFDVDEDDDMSMTDPNSRPGSFDQKRHISESLERGGTYPVRKSQDAAVGALVYMLKKAPPLRQDLPNSNLLQASRPGSWSKSIQNPNLNSDPAAFQDESSLSIESSAFVASKTTADALEELQGYRKMKNLLLSQSGRSHTSASCALAAEPFGGTPTGI